jgi:hypothetical protein
VACREFGSRELEDQVIIAYAYIPTDDGETITKERLTLAFCDGHMPREGEFITLGFVYEIVRVTHRFHSMKNVPNALENQKYFSDVPALELELERR